jgi:N-acetylglucosamine-6-phosphate deacetylase
VLAPGFIDVHIQGAGGADVLDGTPEALATIARTLPRFGTTSFLATTAMHYHKPNHHLQVAAGLVGKDLGGAHLIGIHLEGPFINMEKRGGMSPTCIGQPSAATLQELFQLTGSALKMMTIAPELEGALSIIRQLVAAGVVASFGHSAATYEQTLQGIRAGISHVTHLFNAMSPFHHREPGPLAAIVEQEQVTAQLIADGVHVHPAALRLAWRLFGPQRLIAITDGIQAIGLPEGRYIYNGREYESHNGIARYLDGTLIGTAVGLNTLINRLRQFTGCSLREAIDTATHNPARLLGLDSKGSLEVGKDADVVLLDMDGSVWATLVAGKVRFHA